MNDLDRSRVGKCPVIFLNSAAVPSRGLTGTLRLLLRTPYRVADPCTQTAEHPQPAYVGAGNERDFHSLEFRSGDHELGDLRSLLDRRRNRAS